jgi:hypothetical protein
VEWRINATTFGVEELSSAPGQAQRVVSVQKVLTALEPGENKIEVLAYNAQGLIASDPARVWINYEGQKTKTPPRLIVFAVRVNEYWDR